MIEDKIHFVNVQQVQVYRAERQREKINSEKVEELARSIQSKGLIHTPLLEKVTAKIIVGEHRLEAFRLMARLRWDCPVPEYEGWTKIPVRFAFNVTPLEIKALEFEENVKRTDLNWKEAAMAVLEFHELCIATHGDSWTISATGETLNMTSSNARKHIVTARALREGNEKVQACATRNAALSILERDTERAIASTMEKIVETDINIPSVAGPFEVHMGIDPAEGESFSTVTMSPLPKKPSIIPASDSILIDSFLSWAPQYSGPKFNLLHCDFPYGIKHQKSDQGNSAKWGAYEDDPEVYWMLIECLFQNWHRIMAKSSHIVFWFSMKFYKETVALFEQSGLDITIDPFPLMWLKTDNKGLLPDPQRGPRRIYETALFMSTGDRKVVRPVSNAYGAPTQKKLHLSEKPESVLRHFFRMLVDQYTELLDPTCGSGSALRAAEALKANRVLGIEKNSEFAEVARSELARSRQIAFAQGA